MLLSKATLTAAGTVLVCVILYFFPLFHIHKIDTDRPTDSPDDHAEKPGMGSTLAPKNINSRTAESLAHIFWSEQLPELITKATPIQELLQLASSDQSAARRRFGRQVGLGGSTFFLLSGQGTVQSANEDECRIGIDSNGNTVVLELGILAGNAVREACGLWKADDFPNSQEFNKLSALLNSHCESDVIQPVRSKVRDGATVEFVGCFEWREGEPMAPCKIIPLRLVVDNDQDDNSKERL